MLQDEAVGSSSSSRCSRSSTSPSLESSLSNGDFMTNNKIVSVKSEEVGLSRNQNSSMVATSTFLMSSFPALANPRKTPSPDNSSSPAGQSTSAATMKGGDVIMASMPHSSSLGKLAVSPMINIPAGIYEEMVSADAPTFESLDSNNIGSKLYASARLTNGISTSQNKDNSLKNTSSINKPDSSNSAVNNVNWLPSSKKLNKNSSGGLNNGVNGITPRRKSVSPPLVEQTLSKVPAVSTAVSSTVSANSFSKSTASIAAVSTMEMCSTSPSNKTTTTSNNYSSPTSSTSLSTTSSLLMSSMSACDPLLDGLPDITRSSPALTPIEPVADAGDLATSSAELMELLPVQASFTTAADVISSNNMDSHSTEPAQVMDIRNSTSPDNGNNYDINDDNSSLIDEPEITELGEGNPLKRPFPADYDKENKKQRLSPSLEESNELNVSFTRLLKIICVQ